MRRVACPARPCGPSGMRGWKQSYLYWSPIRIMEVLEQIKVTVSPRSPPTPAVHAVQVHNQSKCYDASLRRPCSSAVSSRGLRWCYEPRGVCALGLYRANRLLESPAVFVSAKYLCRLKTCARRCAASCSCLLNERTKKILRCMHGRFAA